MRHQGEDEILPMSELVELMRTGGLRYDVRTRDKNWLKVLDMFVDEFSTPWCHPKPPGLKMTTRTLSNGYVAYVHNWICVEYDDELKWFVKQHYNAFPRTCKNEETIAALKVPGEFRLGPLQLMQFHPQTPGVANIFSAYHPCVGPAPWIIGMFDVREEPRIAQPHHLQYLPPKYRPDTKVKLSRSLPSTSEPVALFRWFQEEAQMSKVRALSRNPYPGEIMIDAEALEVVSVTEVQGTLMLFLCKARHQRFNMIC